jgi:hypothetical protein
MVYRNLIPFDHYLSFNTIIHGTVLKANIEALLLLTIVNHFVGV